jgi:membrane protein DedA with SNARE-associated domain
MVLCGFLWRLGTFDLIPLYFALMSGDLLADIGWYLVGFYWGHPFIKRFGKFFSITDDSLKRALDLFHKYHERILIISKLTMGFGFALVTLITAGMSKVPFKKYLAFNIVGEMIWTAILMAVGYFFGNLYYTVDKGFRLVTVAGGVIILMAAIYGFSKFARKQFFAQ